MRTERRRSHGERTNNGRSELVVIVAKSVMDETNLKSIVIRS